MNKRGYTYLELLAVLAILSIVFILINQNFNHTVKAVNIGSKINERQQHLRYVINDLYDSIKYSTRVYIESDGIISDVVDEIQLNAVNSFSLNIQKSSGYIQEYIFSDDVLIKQDMELSEFISEITLRRVNIFDTGSLFELTVKSKTDTNFDLPEVNFKVLIYCQNIKS